MRVILVAALAVGCGRTGDPDVDRNLASGPGDAALDYLRASPYSALAVEIDAVEGKGPSSAARSALQEQLERLLDKPGGVTVTVDASIPDQGAPTWTYDAAEDLEIAHRDTYSDRDAGVAAMYLLYLDGHSDQDDSEARVLGYAYHGTSIVMFKDSIDDAGSGLPLIGGDVEPAVIVHEAGHLLGLVDNGVEMVTPHRDEAHGHHDISDDCIMYWAADTSNVVDLLGAGVPDFDDACLADLSAARTGRSASGSGRSGRGR